MSKIYGNTVGVSGLPKSYVLETEDGSQRLVGVLVGEETVMTAQASDIKIGRTAATEDGIIEGTNTITYRTVQSNHMIRPGKKFLIPLSDYNQYDFTKLQCIIVSKNTSLSDSFSAEKIVIDNGVFQVGSVDQISEVTKDYDTQSIDLNLINETDQTKYIRCFTYKEEEI